MLVTAQSAAAARDSAQEALFGEHDGGSSARSGLAMLVPPNMRWSLAETMTQEKEAFGFYFSGHPVEAWRHLTEAQGARTYAAICGDPAPLGGGRVSCVLAALIEDAKWRTPQAGGKDRATNICC